MYYMYYTIYILYMDSLHITAYVNIGIDSSSDFPGGSDGKRVCRQCRRPRFDPWVGKILWRRKWQPTPVLLPGKFHGTEEPGRLQSMGSQRVRHD